MYDFFMEIIGVVFTTPWTTAGVFGALAFLAHTIAYGWYSLYIFRGHVRPNAASWFMWLVGAWVEFVTFNAIDSHWSTSALPFACLVGIGVIFLVTAFMQIKAWIQKEMVGEKTKIVYHGPDRSDVGLVLFDVGAGALWLAGVAAAFANFLAVSTSIFTFWPIWKTTLRHREERSGPWFLWSIAYTLMFLAVIFQGGEEMFEQSFYPLYYLLLHLPVALLCYEEPRKMVREVRGWMMRVYRRAPGPLRWFARNTIGWIF